MIFQILILEGSELVQMQEKFHKAQYCVFVPFQALESAGPLPLSRNFSIKDNYCFSRFKQMFIGMFSIYLQENLVESKHHKLARSLRSGPTDRDLKPNAHTRDQLNVGPLCTFGY